MPAWSLGAKAAIGLQEVLVSGTPRCRIPDCTLKIGRLKNVLDTGSSLSSVAINELDVALITGFLIIGNEVVQVDAVGTYNAGTKTQNIAISRFDIDSTAYATTATHGDGTQTFEELGFWPKILTVAGGGDYNHSSGTLVYQYFNDSVAGGVENPETGTSIKKFGLRQVTVNRPEVVDQDTLDQIAKRAFLTYQNPKSKIELQTHDQKIVAIPGDRINIKKTDGTNESSTNYIVEKTEYNGEQDAVYHTLNAARHYFYDDVADLTKEVESSSGYGQGSSTLTTNDVYDNIKGGDGSGGNTPVPLKVRPFIPSEVKAINSMLLYLSVESFRNFSAGAAITTTTSETEIANAPDTLTRTGNTGSISPGDLGEVEISNGSPFPLLAGSTRVLSLNSEPMTMEITVEAVEGGIVKKAAVAVDIVFGRYNPDGTFFENHFQDHSMFSGDVLDHVFRRTVTLQDPKNIGVNVRVQNLDREATMTYTVGINTDQTDTGHTHENPHSHTADITTESVTDMKLNLVIQGSVQTVTAGINTNGSLTTGGSGSNFGSGTSLTSPISILPKVIEAYGANLKGKFLDIRIQSPTNGKLARVETSIATQLFIGTSKRIAR